MERVRVEWGEGGPELSCPPVPVPLLSRDRGWMEILLYKPYSFQPLPPPQSPFFPFSSFLRQFDFDAALKIPLHTMIPPTRTRSLVSLLSVNQWLLSRIVAGTYPITSFLSPSSSLFLYLSLHFFFSYFFFPSRYSFR